MYRPRILTLTVGFTAGGAEKLLLDIYQSLGKSFHFSAACLKGSGPWEELIRSKGVDTYALGGRGEWDLSVLLKFNKLTKVLRPQIINSHLFKANWVARIIGKIRRIPVICTIHNVANFLNPFEILMERLTAPLATINVCCSKYVCFDNTKRIHYPFRHYIYNGVLIRNYRRRDFWDPQKIIVLSRIDLKQKALAELIEGIALLKSEGVRVFVDIYGEGKDRKVLEQKIEEFGVAEEVRMMGFTTNPEKTLENYSIFLLPSKFEGLPLAILEAISAGLVVVASNVGGVPEVIEDGVTGYLIDGHSPERIAEAIKRVVAEKERLPEISRAAIKKVRENFNIEKTVSYWRRLYQLLLDNPTPDEATLDQMLPHV